ncbi:MAG TPA: hypothetical protein GXX17_07670 [Clostridiales bacterium]|nr:hypothetical protein [Clostridiales bacterium]
MRPTFSGFEVAKTGINAARANLQVAGQNIANANTEGYTRQRVDLYSIAPSGINMRYNSGNTLIGEGVKIGGISQYRDIFLDTQYRQQNTLLAGSQIEIDVLEDLESIFDSVVNSNISDALNTILDALNEFSKNNSNYSYDSTVKNAMKNMLGLLDSLNTQIERVISQQTSYLETGAIKDTNNLLQNIAFLSDQIKKSNISGNGALELLDQRNLMLDRLSSYLDIEVVYNIVSVGSGVTVEEIEVNLLGDNGEKFNLISNSEYRQLEMVKATNGDILIRLLNKDGSAVAASDSGNVQLDGGLINHHLNAGAISSYLKMLNENGAYDINHADILNLHKKFMLGSDLLDTGAVAEANAIFAGYDPSNWQQVLSTLKSLFGSDAVSISADRTAIILTDKNGNTYRLVDNSGHAVLTFSGNDDEGYVLGLTDAMGETVNLNDILENGDFARSLVALNSKEVYDTTVATAKGIGYYKGMLDTFTYTFAEMFNSINSTSGPPYDKPLFESIDGGPIAAGNIKISEQWENALDVYLTATKQTGTNEVFDNVQKMISLLKDGTEFDFFAPANTAGSGHLQQSIPGALIHHSSFKSFFTQIGVDIGLELSTINQKATMYSNSLDSIDSKRYALSGVSEDEEAINLVMYNRSLAAASRFMTTLDEALENIISRMGIVGR